MALRQQRVVCDMATKGIFWCLLLLLLSVGYGTDKLPERNSSGACATQQRHIEDQMDSNIDACVDFFEHACGNWRAPFDLRALGAHDTRTKMRALNKQLLMQHFEKQQFEPNSAVASFYNSCLNARQVMRVYTDALRQHADWPLLDNNNSNNNNNNTSKPTDLGFDWCSVSAQLRRYGSQGLWRLLVQPNWQAAEQRIFYLMPPSFELLRSGGGLGAVTEESKYLYELYIKYLLLDLGVRVRRANAMAAELVAFEEQLDSLTPIDSAQTLVLREPQTLQQLATLLPGLHLLKYFQTLLETEQPLLPYSAEKLLIVADLAYLRQLERLLRSTDPDILAKWLLVQFLAHFELHQHEHKTLADQRSYCLQQLNDFMPRELTQLFLRLLHGQRESFLAETQSQLQLDFAALKLQFERMLNATPIFENETLTQELSLEKLRAMRLLLPLLTPRAGDSSVHVELGDSYDENLLRLSRHQAQMQFSEVLQCLDSEACDANEGRAYGPLDVNAYYRLKQNAIELPVGLLRAPLWSECSDALSRRYGGLGYILGHELLHGFDYDGINYDQAGNVASQWTPRAIIRFGVRAGCYMTTRYSNASLTINENIADSEGLRLAFETYKNSAPGSSTAEQQQQFFMAFAQTWCGHAATSSISSQHASHRERVNNVLSNFPEFAEAFKCKSGSLMHPPECHGLYGSWNRHSANA